MINFIYVAIGIILICVILMNKFKDSSHILPILTILGVSILGVFFSTSDETTLSKIPTVKVIHDNIEEVNKDFDAKLSMGGTYKNKNIFFLSNATTLDDLQNYIDSNNGSCEFILYNSDDTIVFSHVFDKPNASEIYNVFREWKSTGKFDLNTVRVEFFKIFYVIQV